MEGLNDRDVVIVNPENFHDDNCPICRAVKGKKKVKLSALRRAFEQAEQQRI